MTIGEMWVPKIRPDVESFFKSRESLVCLSHVIEDPDPENCDSAVVLVGVATEFGDMADGEARDKLSRFDVVGAVEERPSEAEMGLVTEVLCCPGLMKKTEAIAQVELGHPAAEASSRNSWNEAWMALMSASESGKVL